SPESCRRAERRRNVEKKTDQRTSAQSRHRCTGGRRPAVPNRSVSALCKGDQEDYLRDMTRSWDRPMADNVFRFFQVLVQARRCQSHSPFEKECRRKEYSHQPLDFRYTSERHCQGRSWSALLFRWERL